MRDAELVKWFPLEARSRPASVEIYSYRGGPDCEGEAEIVAREPGRRVAWKENVAVTEFILEARGNKTLVRLVQSGFVGNEDWENKWFESTDYGWGFTLLGLQWSF